MLSGGKFRKSVTRIDFGIFRGGIKIAGGWKWCQKNVFLDFFNDWRQFYDSSYAIYAKALQ